MINEVFKINQLLYVNFKLFSTFKSLKLWYTIGRIVGEDDGYIYFNWI